MLFSEAVKNVLKRQTSSQNLEETYAKEMPMTAKQQPKQGNKTCPMTSYNSEHLLPKIKGFKDPKTANYTV